MTSELFNSLLKSVPKTNGWAEELWDEVDNYFHTYNEVTSQDIINTIKQMTDSQDIIDDVINKLSQDRKESLYAFKNWWEVKSILSDIECIALHVSYIDKRANDLITEDTYLFKCDELSSRHRYRRKITTAIKILHDVDITEETLIDYRKITPTAFRSKFFQNEIKSKKDTHSSQELSQMQLDTTMESK